MSDGNNMLAVLSGPGKLQDKPKLLKEAFDSWVKIQPPYVEALSAGLFGTFQGAFLGTLMGSMTKSGMDAAPPGTPAMPSMMKMGGPLQQARNFAVMTGVNSGVNTFMRRTRGVDDIQNTMVAGFLSGGCFSLVSGMGSPSPAMPGMPAPNPLMGAFSAAVVFSLFQGGFYKLGEMFGGPKTEDTEYLRVRAMLGNLGLSKYEKNARKSLLNDTTIMLWDTPSLQEANIPPGPRLLILHHIDLYRSAAGKNRNEYLTPALPVPAK